MSEEFGPTFVTITDDDGQELVLEYVASAEVNGTEFRAFFPTESEDAETDSEKDEEVGLIILKVIEENGEELLSTCDSEDEVNAAYDVFMEILFDDEYDETT